MYYAYVGDAALTMRAFVYVIPVVRHLYKLMHRRLMPYSVCMRIQCLPDVCREGVGLAVDALRRHIGYCSCEGMTLHAATLEFVRHVCYPMPMTNLVIAVVCHRPAHYTSHIHY